MDRISDDKEVGLEVKIQYRYPFNRLLISREGIISHNDVNCINDPSTTADR
jgi:hypothetical protein